MAEFLIKFMPGGQTVSVPEGTNLLEAARSAGLTPNAPCGGKGTCGKCKVRLLHLPDSPEVLACQTPVTQNMTVRFLSDEGKSQVISTKSDLGLGQFPPDSCEGYCVAFDIGTTTVVGYLLSADGQELGSVGRLNPQMTYGADVISRINYCLENTQEPLTTVIRSTLKEQILLLCEKQGISDTEIRTIAVVGNTCMHHMLMAIDPRPLVTPPYSPGEKRPLQVSAMELLGICPNAQVRVFPNIAGFVGGDTVGCMTALEFDKLTEPSLLIDIGTNGELVMTDGKKMLACSTAAGPAFEGAKISCGMRAADGAIDHVWLENGEVRCSVLGDAEPIGICGSALLDAIAVFLDLEDIGESGRVLTDDRLLHLKGNVALTQNDVNELQFAKGAIAAGIEMMADDLGLDLHDIQAVYLAGAFGNYMNPDSACRIGLIPAFLRERIKPCGNAAGKGSQMAAVSREAYEYANTLATASDFLDLAAQPDFQDTYVEHLCFEEEEE